MSTSPQEDLFNGVVHFIDPSVPPHLAKSINKLLFANGAQAAPGPSEGLTTTDVASTSQPRFDLLATTHVITKRLDIPEYRNLGTELECIGNVLLVDLTEISNKDLNMTHDPPESRSDSRPIDSTRANKRYIRLVTPKWVMQSYDSKYLLPTESYSPDPLKIFSGLVIALDSSTELPIGDLEVIEATVIARGGQFKRGLSTDTTHLLFRGDFSKKIRKLAGVGIKIVLPHWLHICTLLCTIVPEGPFQFPTPPILKSLEPSNNPSESNSAASSSVTLSPSPVTTGSSDPLSSLMGNLKKEADFAKFLKAHQSRQEQNGINENASTTFTDQIHPELDGKWVYLASSLQLSPHSRETLVERMKQMGANVYDAETDDPHCKKERDASDMDAEKALSDANFVICDSRSGWEFWLAWEFRKTIGTLRWITTILSTTTSLHRGIRSPLESLLDYPLPPRPISGRGPQKNLVTITNYTGTSRSYLIRLIQKMGLKYEGTLTANTWLLVAADKTGQKVEFAPQLGIPIVNHLYIEDCFRNWSKLPIQSIHKTYPENGKLPEPTGEPGYTSATIEKWAQTFAATQEREAAMEERKALLQESRSRNTTKTTDTESKEPPPDPMSCPDTTTLEDEDLTIREESDQMDLDEISYPNPPSDLMICEGSKQIRNAVSRKSDKLSSSTKNAPRDTCVDQSMNGSSSPLPSDPIMNEHTTRTLKVKDSEFTEENGNGKLHTTSAPSEPGPACSPEGTPEPDDIVGRGGRRVHSATKSTSHSKRTSQMDASNSTHTGKEAHRPHKRSRSSLDHLTNGRPAEDQDGVASRNQSPSLQLPDPDREKETTKRDESNAGDVLFEDVTKTDPNAVADATKSVNDTYSRNTPRTSNKKVPQKRHSDTPKRENDVPMAGTSQSIKRASTRMAAKKTAAKVADCAADMLVHEKEKKRKVLSGAGLAGTSNGGYFGDVGAKPPSASKNRSGDQKCKIKRGRSLVDTDQARPVTSASKSTPGRIKLEDEDADSPSLSKLRYRKISDQHPDDEGSGSESNDDLKAVNGTAKQSRSNRRDARSCGPSRKNISKAETSSKTDKLMQADVRILQTVIRLDTKLIQKLEKLGVIITDEVEMCTHLVTDRIYRSVKFIQAIILGVHIVDQKWAEACANAGQMIEPDDYLLYDPQGEKTHKFSLQESLSRARKAKLLSGETFYVSPSVKPDGATIKELIELADGKVITTTPLVRNIREHPERRVISCEEDSGFWKALMKKKPKEDDIPIYTSEVILAGLLTQKMNYNGDKSQLETQKIIDKMKIDF